MKRDEIAFGEGQAVARIDVAEGRFVYRWSGSAGHWGHWIVTQFEDRFGVSVEGFAICFVNAASVSFNNGYNAIVIAEIEKLHGTGAFQALLDEAQIQSELTLYDARDVWFRRHPQG